MIKKQNLPNRYTEDKSFTKQVIDWAVPVGIFLLYFVGYNAFVISPSEMIKTTGLVSICLLSLTLIVGPVSMFFPALNSLKAHRKIWGISSFVFLAAHMGLVLVYRSKLYLQLLNPAAPRFWGAATGMAAFIVLLIVTFTSNKKAIAALTPKVWKIVQTTSYIALILAVAHFYAMEQVDGVLVIKRLLGNITYWFAIVAIIARLLVVILPKTGYKAQAK